MRKLASFVVAVFLAFVLWFVVSAPRLERVREKIFTSSISLVALPSDMVITSGDLTGSVTVRVRGRASDLRVLTPAALDVPIDLSWVDKPGEIEITIRPEAINVPPEVEVVTISPNKFRFRVEELRQWTVPIRPFLAGDAPVGYIVGDPTVDPDRALVSGPASQVKKLTEVTTERIIMTGRTATFVQTVAVVSDSPLVRVISPLTTSVTVPVLAEMGPNPETATDTTGTAATTTTQEQ